MSTQNHKLIEILKNIGLEEVEANVYVTSLSLGATSVLRIAKHSEIKRTTCYGVIESLHKKGLMRTELRGLKQVYIAENPEKLELILESKQQEFKNNLPQFIALQRLQGTESTIKLYTGLKVLQEIYMQTLKEIKHGEDYLVIANQESWYNLDPEFAIKYIEERAKLPIKTRLLLQDSEISRTHKKYERNYNEEIKFFPSDTSINVDTILLPKKLIIAELLPPYTITVIENTSIIELHRELFEINWKTL